MAMSITLPTVKVGMKSSKVPPENLVGVRGRQL